MSPRNRLPGYESVAAAGHEQRVAEHIELVHRIAHHLMARLPASVQVDDLIQAGMIGLLEARGSSRAGRARPSPPMRGSVSAAR